MRREGLEEEKGWLGERYQEFSIRDVDSEMSRRHRCRPELAARWPEGWSGGNEGQG